MSDKRTPRAIDIARAIEQDAPLIRAALNHLDHLESTVQLWPTATTSDGATRAGSTVLVETETDDQPTIDPALALLMKPDEFPQPNDDETTTERIAVTSVEREIIRVDLVRERRHHLREMLRAIDGNRKDLHDYCHDILRTRELQPGEQPPPTKPRCYSDPGLAGYLLPRFDDEGNLLPIDTRGWSDPACTNIPRNGRAGLCDPCRKRCADWRQRHGETQLEEVVHLDDVRIRLENGVAIVTTHLPRDSDQTASVNR